MTEEVTADEPVESVDGVDPFERMGTELDRGRRSLASLLPMAPEAALGVIGVVAFTAGIALILLGWSGVAHSRYLQQELAYVVSGGLLGLALVVLGGCFYLGYLLMRQARHLERLVVATEGRNAPGAAVAPAVAPPEPVPPAPVAPAPARARSRARATATTVAEDGAS